MNPWIYSRHHRDHAEGHIFMPDAIGACTIQLTGAAAMSQEQLDSYARTMIAAPRLIEALQAIKARIDGEFDHPALKAIGPLNTDKEIDILNIIEKALPAQSERK